MGVWPNKLMKTGVFVGVNIVGHEVRSHHQHFAALIDVTSHVNLPSRT